MMIDDLEINRLEAEKKFIVTFSNTGNIARNVEIIQVIKLQNQPYPHNQNDDIEHRIALFETIKNGEQNHFSTNIFGMDDSCIELIITFTDGLINKQKLHYEIYLSKGHDRYFFSVNGDSSVQTLPTVV